VGRGSGEDRSANGAGGPAGKDTGDFGRSFAGTGSTGLSGKSFDGFDGCSFGRVGGRKDVPATSGVDFRAGDTA